MPIIVVSNRTDVAMVVQAMKAGAAEFFLKPFYGDAVVSALRQSLARSAATLDHEAELQALRNCYARLTGREREVMALVISGRLNKEVGGELGISEITVKAHRGKVMRKMKAASLVALVHMAGRLRLTGNPFDSGLLASPAAG
jgi:FixJ family two-component response regulator